MTSTPKPSWLLFVFTSLAVVAGAAPLPLLKTARQIRALTAEEAAKGYPVDLTGVVTYADKSWRIMWIQDDTAGIFINLVENQSSRVPEAGDLVRVRGNSSKGEFAPCIREGETEILGPGKPSEPARVSFAELMSGRYHARSAEVEGWIRSGKLVNKRLMLAVQLKDGRINANMGEYPPDWEKRLVHAKVAIRGALTTNFNSRRQMIGVGLFAPPQGIRILEQPEPDPFQVRLTPMAMLGHFSAMGQPDRRVRVQGTVAAVEPDRAVYLSDNSSRVAVLTSKTAGLKPGDLAEAVGYFTFPENRPTLEDAVVRGSGKGIVLVPQQVTGRQVIPEDSGMHGNGTAYDLTFVTIEGTLLRTPTDPRDGSLLLQDDRGLFVATLAPSAGKALPSLQPGSVLRIQGVCLVAYHKRYEVPESFRILLRSPSDIVVLKHASWWTLRHSLWVIAGIALFIPAVLAWVWLLRKRVARQTEIIRSRLHAEAKLESRYRRLFERNLAAFVRTTYDGRFLDWNPAAARLLGVTFEAGLQGKYLHEFCKDHQALNGAGVLGQDVALRDAAGNTRWALSSSMVTEGDDGGDPVIECTFIDITQRRLAESALRRSEEKYRTLFDAISEHVFIVDPVTGRIVDCNAAVLRTYGYSLQELRGLTLEDLAETASSHRTKAGKLLDVEIETEEIEYEGRPATMRIVRDVTRQRLFESELMKARDAAQSANKAKSEFLANMSHEIRTPLNGVLGMAELALDGDLPAEEREYLKLLKVSADSLLSVINDILDFSKIEAGKLELEHIPFNVREVFGDTLKTMAARAEQKRLELIFDVPEDVPDFVAGDPTRLRQVILNLVSNAIKFTARGDVTLRVTYDASGADRQMLHFEIADTGIGIAPGKIGSVFDAFSQADGSMTRRYGGTGLGLTICSRLVSIMGGRIWAESKLGEGSRFCFTIPVEPCPANSQSTRHTRDAVLTGVRVVLVDNHTTHLTILQRMLSAYGMNVTTAASAAAAHEAMAAAAGAGAPCQLLVSDVHLDDMDGFDLVECIRLDSRIPPAPAVLLASAIRPGEATRCRELNIAAYLMKPVSRDAMRRAIAGALDTNHAPGTSKAAPSVKDLEVLRVLLVEDNAVNQTVATRLLEKRGHHVEVACDGIEALEAFQRQTFDLVLMDVQMPRMDGLDATRRIRELEALSGGHVPILAMTAHAMKGDGDRCLDAGMDSYLCKPISADKLYGAIQDLQQQSTAEFAGRDAE